VSLTTAASVSIICFKEQSFICELQPEQKVHKLMIITSPFCCSYLEQPFQILFRIEAGAVHVEGIGFGFSHFVEFFLPLV